MPPRRRDHHGLRQIQNIQGWNSFEVLQGQGGDRPHDVRREALGGEGGARDREHDRRRKEGEPSGDDEFLKDVIRGTLQEIWKNVDAQVEVLESIRRKQAKL